MYRIIHSIQAVLSTVPTAALFTASKRQKLLRCPSVGEYKTKYSIYINGILFRLKMEGNSVTCCNVDEPWGNYANKPITKRQTLYEVFRKVKIIETECVKMIARGLWKGRKGVIVWWVLSFHFIEWKELWTWVVMMVAQWCECISCHWTIHLKIIKMVMVIQYVPHWSKIKNLPSNWLTMTSHI